MTDDDVRFDLEHEHEVPFRLLDGSTVPVRVRSVRAGGEVTVSCSVTVDAWERIFTAGAFHLDDEPPAYGFEPDRPVALELRLRTAVAGRHRDPDELVRSLLGDTASELHATEAWQATEAVQRLEVPGTTGEWVDVGLRTRFADPFAGRPGA